MSWFGNEKASPRDSFSQRLGWRLLILFLFLYFSYSGSSDLGLMSGIPGKFEGHFWLGKVVGILELSGGLALLREEGIFGGACFLMAGTLCALTSTLVHHQTYAAIESLVMMNICAGIAYSRLPRRN